jgi:hypothetical protein
MTDRLPDALLRDLFAQIPKAFPLHDDSEAAGHKAARVGRAIDDLALVLDEIEQAPRAAWLASCLGTLQADLRKTEALGHKLDVVAETIAVLGAPQRVTEAVLRSIRTAQATARRVATLTGAWIADARLVPDEPPRLVPELTGARWERYVAAWRDRSPGFVKEVLADQRALARGQHLLATLPDGEWESFLSADEEPGVEMTAEEFERWAATGELPCLAPSA